MLLFIFFILLILSSFVAANLLSVKFIFRKRRIRRSRIYMMSFSMKENGLQHTDNSYA